MTPFQLFLTVLVFVTLPAAWLLGGRPEREAVALMALNLFIGNLLFHVRIGNFSIGEAIGDVLLLAGFAWLALRRDRWWLLAGTALAALTMAVHATTLLTPAITPYADISARWGLGAMTCWRSWPGSSSDGSRANGRRRWRRAGGPRGAAAIWTMVRERPRQGASSRSCRCRLH